MKQVYVTPLVLVTLFDQSASILLSGPGIDGLDIDALLFD